MKKFLAVLLCICMIASLCVIGVGAEAATAANVAKIGDTEYATLVEAVGAAKSGETVKVLRNCSGAGIATFASGTPAVKDFTIDFGGYTYTCTGPAVGSTGTQNQAFHLERGANVTLKNGTIIANSSAISKCLIQNYCNLTLQDITLDATAGSNSARLALSSNSGIVNIVGNTNIIGRNAAGCKAFDACWGSAEGYPEGTQVTVNTTGNIVGLIEFDAWTEKDTPITPCMTTLKIENCNSYGDFYFWGMSDEVIKNNFTITGGSFTADPSAYIPANAGVVCSPHPFPYNGVIYSGYKVGAPVASIDDAEYSSVQSAANCANKGQTIKLLKDTDENVEFASATDLTFDLNGNVLTGATSGTGSWGDLAVQNANTAIVNKRNLTIQDSSASKTGRVTAAGEYASALYNDEGATATLNGGTFTTNTAVGALTTTQQNNMYVIRNHGTMTMNDGVKVTTGGAYQLNGNTMITNGYEQNENNGSEAHLSQNAVMTINGGTYEGGIFVVKNGDWSGEMTINGGTFTIRDTTSGSASNWGAVISNSNNCTMTINNGTFNGAAAGKDPVVKAKTKSTDSEGTGLTILGGTFTGPSDVLQTLKKSTSHAAIINVQGGSFNGTINRDTEAMGQGASRSYEIDASKLSISGGYFTADPSDFLADGKAAVESDNNSYIYMIADKSATPAEVIAAMPAVNNTIAANPNKDQDEINAAADLANAIANPEPSASPLAIDEDVVNAAANTVANNNTTSAEQGADELKAAGITNATAQNTTIVIQTYIDVSINDVSIKNGVKTLTLEITPMYQELATTADTTNDEDIVADSTDPGYNAVKIGSSHKLTITKPVTVTIPLSEDYQSGTIVYVKHKLSSGQYKTYTGVVDEHHVLTFYDPDGFSSFTLSSVNDSAAEIDGVGYDTLQEAVDAVQNGQTITILKAGQTASVNRTVNFTVTPKGMAYTIAVGANSKNSGTGDNYDITYTAPAAPAIPVSGGSTAAKTYTVTVDKADNGTVTASAASAEAGKNITVTAAPAAGYTLDAITVKDDTGAAVAAAKSGDNACTFTMPAANVTVTAAFKKVPAPEWKNPFTDVVDKAWYYDAVKTANQANIIKGTSDTTFSPDQMITRQEMWMILSRMSGKTPTTMAEARTLAMAAKITDGTNPTGTITREQFATMLFRYAKLMGLDTTQGGMAVREFADYGKISGFALEAMTWAVNAGLMNGYNNMLMPGAGTSRGQAVVILVRAYSSIIK